MRLIVIVCVFLVFTQHIYAQKNLSERLQDGTLALQLGGNLRIPAQPTTVCGRLFDDTGSRQSRNDQYHRNFVACLRALEDQVKSDTGNGVVNLDISSLGMSVTSMGLTHYLYTNPKKQLACFVGGLSTGVVAWGILVAAGVL